MEVSSAEAEKNFPVMQFTSLKMKNITLFSLKGLNSSFISSDQFTTTKSAPVYYMKYLFTQTWIYRRSDVNQNSVKRWSSWYCY